MIQAIFEKSYETECRKSVSILSKEYDMPMAYFLQEAII